MTYTPKLYAEALRSLAESNEAFRGFIADLCQVRNALSTDEVVRSFFFGRTGNFTRRVAVLHEVLDGVIAAPVIGVIRLMAESGGLRKLDAVIRAADRIADAEDGVTTVTVESAITLSGEQQKHIEQTLCERIGTAVLASYSVDPSCIGGLRVCIAGTKQIDLTVSGNLAQLRQFFRR
ncbi:MAG: ATP synthase F1 subunit delta [Candidatus Uhrbacteria bacterium]